MKVSIARVISPNRTNRGNEVEREHKRTDPAVLPERDEPAGGQQVGTYPFKDRVRLVGEVNGVFKQHEIPENSGLIGIIGEVRGIDLDIGLRKGFTDTFSY